MSETLYPTTSEDDRRRRLKGLWQRIAAQQLDALVVYGDSASNGGNLANVFYLTGYKDPLFAYAIVLPGEEPRLLISNPLYLPHAEVMATTPLVQAVSWDPGAHIADVLAGLGVGGGRLGLVGVRGIQRSSLPDEHARRLQERLPSATWEDATEILVSARRIKSAEELGLMRRGAQLTDQTLAALRTDGRVGMSELQLAGLVYGTAFGQGGEQRLTFIGSTPMDEPSLVFPRQTPSQRTIRPGDVVLTELSTAYGGYSGQAHRPFAVGVEPSAEYARLFDVAREVYERVLEGLGPGKTDEDVRAAAAPVIGQAGVVTMDALVHGWGLTIEPPRLDVAEAATIQRPQEPTVFEPGMAMVVQPHVLSSDRRRGLQVGALVAITDHGVEILHDHPMEFGVIQ